MVGNTYQWHLCFQSAHVIAIQVYNNDTIDSLTPIVSLSGIKDIDTVIYDDGRLEKSCGWVDCCLIVLTNYGFLNISGYVKYADAIMGLISDNNLIIVR